MDTPVSQDVVSTLAAARSRLLVARARQGIWRGQLTSSALSTAVAALALHGIDPRAHLPQVRGALRWLAEYGNPDGGWGDTVHSPSNLSTTLLAWSALALADADDAACAAASAGAGAWIERRCGTLEPCRLAQAVLKAYGADRTFSAPILTVCALSGRLGANPWQAVPQLPFELTLLPHRWFRFARLSVVSYALPALIAIGLVRHHHPPRGPWPARGIRAAAQRPALRVLRACQPSNGGFLEAAPLTGFVAASLAASDLAAHPVAAAAVEFLRAGVRADGSWPIDTDLAAWVTSLSIEALRGDLEPGLRDELRRHLLAQQHRVEHPYTHAAPGGWAWSDRPGAVPDADDTAGALLALRRLTAAGEGSDAAAASAGIRWLLGLQNRDGGMPTFCRGWGQLPFDRSCPDLTAHALRAFAAWESDMPADLRRQITRAAHRALRYLQQTQDATGAWTPLWFGNQAAPGQANRTYGTAQVLRALTNAYPPRRRSERGEFSEDMTAAGVGWLLAAQHPSGGWGGDVGVQPTIEETALAVAALAASADERARTAARAGAAWLVRETAGGTHFPAAPIGLYFARLWYAEELYPLIFTVEALTVFHRRDAEIAEERGERTRDGMSSAFSPPSISSV